MRLALAVLLAAALAGTAGATATPPTLRIARSPALVVRGAHFRPGERVTVTAVAARRYVLRTRADAIGSFVARFGTDVVVGRCEALAVVALGARGDRAAAMLPKPMCAPAVTQ